MTYLISMRHTNGTWNEILVFDGLLGAKEMARISTTKDIEYVEIRRYYSAHMLGAPIIVKY